MADLNKVILVGRVTNDFLLQKTKNNISYARNTIAVTRYTTSNTQRVSDFLPFVAWRNQAEFLCKYVKKGDTILLEGKIQSNSYNNNEGTLVRSIDIIVDNVQILASKNYVNITNYGQNNYSQNKPSYQANTYSDLNQSVNLSIEEKDISSSAVFSRAETEEDDDSISANDFENITDDLNDDIDLDKGF